MCRYANAYGRAERTVQMCKWLNGVCKLDRLLLQVSTDGKDSLHAGVSASNPSQTAKPNQRDTGGACYILNLSHYKKFDITKTALDIKKDASDMLYRCTDMRYRHVDIVYRVVNIRYRGLNIVYGLTDIRYRTVDIGYSLTYII